MFKKKGEKVNYRITFVSIEGTTPGSALSIEYKRGITISVFFQLKPYFLRSKKRKSRRNDRHHVK